MNVSGKCFDSTWFRTLILPRWLNPWQMLQKYFLESESLSTYWRKSEGSWREPGKFQYLKSKAPHVHKSLNLNQQSISLFMLFTSMLFKSLFCSQSHVTNVTLVNECFWKMFWLHMIANIVFSMVAKSMTNVAEIFLGVWILYNVLKQICRVLNRICKQ